jgi:outer membrane protein OmpA-like peptidoglycan-associated protein
MRSRLLAATGLAAAVAAIAVPRPAAADDISVELIGKALKGQTRPGLVLFANKAVVEAKASLKRADGTALVLRSGNIPPGGKKELLFDAPTGTHRYAGTLAVDFIDGTSGEMPLSFDVFVSEGVEVRVIEEKLDLKEGNLAFTFTGAASKCEYDVAFDGKPPRHGWVRYAGEPAGTELALRWPTHGAADTVLRIQLTCHDAEGFFSPTVELFPWKIDIPHEDVVFATGKSAIAPDEARKLDAARGEIASVLRRYQQALQLGNQRIGLYVIGHTDTVGDAASNRRLSLERARAIAGWFRAKGLSMPIHFSGAGEDALAVSTPDETDEPRNRRAEYIITVSPPAGVKWTKL